MPPKIDHSKCLPDCDICYDICPCDVFGKVNGKIMPEYDDECWHCLACEIECPKNAVYVDLHYMMG